jgi:hypothetical protein
MILDLSVIQLQLDTTVIAGASLWSLALYVGFPSWREWVTTQMYRWFNFADQSLFFSTQEFEQTRSLREAQNAFVASVFSILPFLGMGVLCNLGLDLGLGQSWSISLGILTCISFGIYQLGRQQSNQKS